MNLIKNCLVTKVVTATTGGLGLTDGSVLDMSGYEGVLFVANIIASNTSTANGIHLQSGSSSGGGDDIDVTDSQITSSGTVVLLDVYKPTKRYLTGVLEQSSGSTGSNSLTAIQYGARVLPTSQNYDSDLIIGTDSGTI